MRVDCWLNIISIANTTINNYWDSVNAAAYTFIHYSDIDFHVHCAVHGTKLIVDKSHGISQIAVFRMNFGFLKTSVPHNSMLSMRYFHHLFTCYNSLSLSLFLQHSIGVCSCSTSTTFTTSVQVELNIEQRIISYLPSIFRFSRFWSHSIHLLLLSPIVVANSMSTQPILD